MTSSSLKFELLCESCAKTEAEAKDISKGAKDLSEGAEDISKGNKFGGADSKTYPLPIF